MSSVIEQRAAKISHESHFLTDKLFNTAVKIIHQPSDPNLAKAIMPYNGSTNGSAGGGGGVLVVSDGPQNKKIRTGVQQAGDGDVHMIARVSSVHTTFINTYIHHLSK